MNNNNNDNCKLNNFQLNKELSFLDSASSASAAIKLLLLYRILNARINFILASLNR